MDRAAVRSRLYLIRYPMWRSLGSSTPATCCYGYSQVPQIRTEGNGRGFCPRPFPSVLTELAGAVDLTVSLMTLHSDSDYAAPNRLTEQKLN